MVNKIVLSTTFLAACASVTMAAGVFTVPMKGYVKPQQMNAVSLTHHYLRKRADPSSSSLTSVMNDIMYTVSLGIGSPPQYFNLAIDTGSPITWVVSKNCTGSECENVNNHFNCTASSTCKPSPSSGLINAKYVSGSSIKGSYVTETFNLGNIQFPSLAGVVTTNNAPLPPTIDGILGLWFAATSIRNVPEEAAILKVLKKSTALAKLEVGIFLDTTTGDELTAPGGEITFGGVDPARYTGEFTYINCVPHPPWTIPVERLSVNGQNFNVAGSLATIDTGTSAMLLPKELADAINYAIPDSGTDPNEEDQWFLPCSGDIPITITLGGFTAIIPYTTLAMQNIRKVEKSTGREYCQSAAMFASGPVSTINEWLLGDVFLKNVYTVFDFGTNAATGGRIGFANLAGPIDVNSTSGGSNDTTTGTTGNPSPLNAGKITSGDNGSNSASPSQALTSRGLQAMAIAVSATLAFL